MQSKDFEKCKIYRYNIEVHFRNIVNGDFDDFVFLKSAFQQILNWDLAM